MYQRLIAFYHAATRSPTPKLGDIWESIIATCQKPLVDALVEGKPERLEKALNELALSGALGGIEALAPLTRAQFDNLLHRICFRMGLLPVPNPEQPSPDQNWQLRDTNAMLLKVGETIGVPLVLPDCFGFNGMLMPHRFLFYLSAAFTIQQQVEEFGHVLEIGGGLGNLGFISHHKGALSYTVIDLPSVAVMSAFFMSKVCGPDKVWLWGELYNPDAFARFYPADHCAPAAKQDYTVIFNSDSLPELPSSVQDRYLRLIPECLHPEGIFLSINHESNRAGQGSVPAAVKRNGGLRLTARYPFMMRDGYIEEIYKV